MALQNIRALRMVFEDLSFGGGSTRHLVRNQTVAATALPLLQTIGFGSSIPVAFITAQTVGIGGQSRWIVSRSPNFFMSLTGTVNNVAVLIPIAPLQQVFLPQGFVGTAMTMNWAAGPVGLPLATSTTRLTFDYGAEA